MRATFQLANSHKNLDEGIIKILKPILEDKSIKNSQNIKFDFIILFKRGIEMNTIEDTMPMSYVLDAGKTVTTWTHFQKLLKS